MSNKSDYTEDASFEFSLTKNNYLRITLIKKSKQETWICLSPKDQEKISNFIKNNKPKKEKKVMRRYSLVADILSLLGIVFVILLFWTVLFGKVNDWNGNQLHQGKYFNNNSALTLSFPNTN